MGTWEGGQADTLVLLILQKRYSSLWKDEAILISVFAEPETSSIDLPIQVYSAL